jgi:hypothetical protein
MAAFWSHAEVRRSAASAAGRVPPMTQPKKRLPEERWRPSFAGFDELFDDYGGIEAGVGQLDAEGRAEVIEGRGSRDAGLRLGDVFEGVIEG